MSFFKAYDMRGTFGRDFNLDTVYRIGRWMPSVLRAQKFLIGRDIRLSSQAIRNALCDGLNDAGADVDDMGLSTTPMVYFFTARKKYDASVQITASHNPAGDNGMKVSSRGALPVGGDTGLKDIEARILSGKLLERAPRRGVTRCVDFFDEYVQWMKSLGLNFNGVNFAVDCSNGASCKLTKSLLNSDADLFSRRTVFINDTPDGSFPGHEPNPLLDSARVQINQTVRENKLDCGLIFDGDADRVMVVDENGNFIQPDYLIPKIAEYFLALQPGSSVIHDIRTSRGAIEALHAAGAKTIMGKVGHAFAKLLLRDSGSVFGGELAGHYYFRDFYNCDSAMLAALHILSAFARAKERGLTFSQWMAPVMRYPTTGEVNFTIEDKSAAVEAATSAILQKFGEPQSRADFDGVRLEYDIGWVNIRQSNTEPYLRVIAEGRDKNARDELAGTVIAAITPYLQENDA